MPARHLTAELPGSDPLVRVSSLDVLDNSVMLRKSGLLFARGVGFNKWESIGRQLLSVTESATWWIADWIAYGELTFQDRYREAVQRTSLNYQTLRNYVWVARRFDLSRRRDNLSFGHHAEVAALDRPEQDYWLRKAEELTWSRNQLRSEVRNSLRIRKADDESRTAYGAMGAEERTGDGDHTEVLTVGDGTKMISLRLTSHQFARFTMIARSRNQNLEEWAVQALEKMCPPSGDLLSRIVSVRWLRRLGRSDTFTMTKSDKLLRSITVAGHGLVRHQVPALVSVRVKDPYHKRGVRKPGEIASQPAGSWLAKFDGVLLE